MEGKWCAVFDTCFLRRKVTKDAARKALLYFAVKSSSLFLIHTICKKICIAGRRNILVKWRAVEIGGKPLTGFIRNRRIKEPIFSA